MRRMTMVAMGALLLAGCGATRTGDEAEVQPPPWEAQSAGASPSSSKVGESMAKGALIGLQAPLALGPIGILAYPLIAPYTVLGGALGGAAVGAVRDAIGR